MSGLYAICIIKILLIDPNLCKFAYWRRACHRWSIMDECNKRARLGQTGRPNAVRFYRRQMTVSSSFFHFVHDLLNLLFGKPMHKLLRFRRIAYALNVNLKSSVTSTRTYYHRYNTYHRYVKLINLPLRVFGLHYVELMKVEWSISSHFVKDLKSCGTERTICTREQSYSTSSRYSWFRGHFRGPERLFE